MQIEYRAHGDQFASAIAINQHHVISGPIYLSGDKYRFTMTDEALEDLEARGFEVRIEVHI